ncbi:MAG: rod shape-determining protein MreC [Porphyromonadaceae bacterium]|nr:rod shape-determining protein MreC [Porphyromonadaceae bacterium]
MRRLVRFFIHHSSAFVYLCCVVVCLILLFGFNPYQQSVYFTSANRVAGTFYSLSGTVTGYFGLRKENSELMAQNGKLQDELTSLRHFIALHMAEDSLSSLYPTISFVGKSPIVARVINNSVTRQNNTITINKGYSDGVTSQMGLVDQNGIVGVISKVSSGYAVALSLLNPQLRISCKVKNTQYIGSLVWNGKSPRYAELEELPEYMTVNVGDTIITSGYSATFPEGLVVGYVENSQKQKRDNFYALTVRLAADFMALNHVMVVGGDTGQAKIEKEEARYYE